MLKKAREFLLRKNRIQENHNKMTTEKINADENVSKEVEKAEKRIEAGEISRRISYDDLVEGKPSREREFLAD